ncbi:hypothetical protein MRB53_002174 [Persea americana]|uniref:Uncharacterized protein n=1 Tax=Persea americana TaxID=3435 RepID=A0ACC2MTR9_PERAE|nr:hypothetical protein MRB53_002174 [Persea americana]
MLDTVEGNQEFQWQPYRHLILQLEHFVETWDRQLFRATAPLIYYWIIEQDNVDRVYKQFGLGQPVPPTSHRWERLNEKSSEHNVDYAERCKKYVDAWELRGDIIVVGGADDQMHCHGEEYLSWYRQASVMSTASSKNVPRARVEKALTKVDLFLQFGVGSIAFMDREQGANVLYEQAMRVRRKMQEFRESTKTLAGLEEFSLEAFINDQFSDDSASVSVVVFWLYS